MNLILFEAHELGVLLGSGDRRTRHVLDVLRRRPGDQFDVGLIDGPRGKATVERADADGLRLSFEWGEEPPPLEPVTLIVGLPRPQTARKVLEEMSALGVRAMHFVSTERREPGYAQSRLWSTGEWRRHVIAGAEQAFSTRLAAVTWGRSLDEAIEDGETGGTRLALDNYEAQEGIGGIQVATSVTIAVGPERGWSERERAKLRDAGFRFVHLGERVLRVETACVAAMAVVMTKLRT